MRQSNTRYIREQRTICGEKYMEVDCFPVTEQEHKASTRSKKRKASSIQQQEKNAKASRRKMVQTMNCNFDERGFHVTLTYDDEHLPEDEERAHRDVMLYKARVERAVARKGMDPAALKWMGVLEYQREDPLQALKEVRFHHHVLVQGDGYDRKQRQELREILEDQWACGRWEKEKLGTVNADRLQPEQDGLQKLANYLLKYPKRKKRWWQSRGLKKPEIVRPNDTKWTRKRLAEACTMRIDDKDWWEQRYKGWRFLGAEAVFDEERAEWRLYARLYREPQRVKLWQPLEL